MKKTIKFDWFASLEIRMILEQRKTFILESGFLDVPVLAKGYTEEIKRIDSYISAFDSAPLK